MVSSRGQFRESWVGKNRRKKKEEKAERQNKGKQKKGKMIEVRKVVEEWEIWNKEEEVAQLGAEAKKLVLEKFYK